MGFSIKQNGFSLCNYFQYCVFLELDELKSQLVKVGTQVSEDLSRQLLRKRSRVSESVSESGSIPALNSLQRQKSEDSAKSPRKGNKKL